MILVKRSHKSKFRQGKGSKDSIGISSSSGGLFYAREMLDILYPQRRKLNYVTQDLSNNSLSEITTNGIM
ncbi:hypothetical protein Glove_621g49 [Diversispora epigaea]|uniref:Uncharacterized protein n=1 Tax=Diversispora epigaea TaxID=1348612 RepID=A0A397GAM4_9GLOM|nr:hypothetical protein Glove_621g49 [Diversispora epigaea]